MNSFIKNNKRFFSLLLGLLLNSTLFAITVNNTPIDSILQPGEALLITFPEENDVVVVLEMENGNLNTKTAALFFLSSMLKEKFEKNNSKYPRLVKLTSSVISKVINYKSSYLIGKQLNFQSKKLLRFTDCFFEAPSISIAGDRMLFKDCFFIDSQILSLCINSPQSDYRVIKVLFHDEVEVPTVLAGSVDFLKLNKIPQVLVLSNVKAIEIEFNPQVWDK